MLRNVQFESYLGNAKIVHKGGADTLHVKIDEFIKKMDKSSGKLFDLPVKIGIELCNKEKDSGKNAYMNASKIDYLGFDKPRDWEVRWINANKAIYYVPKHDGYVLVNKKDGIQVKLFLDSDYRVFTIALLELIQLATTKPMFHATALNYNSKCALIIGDTQKGKTTLLLQLVNAKTPVSLTTEDRSILSGNKIYTVSTYAQVRKKAANYLGLNIENDQYVEMSKYLSISNPSDNVSAILYPEFNLQNIYRLGNSIKNTLKPVHRDWFMQVFQKGEIAALIDSKSKELESLPQNGKEFCYSTDPLLTAELFKKSFRMETC